MRLLFALWLLSTPATSAAADVSAAAESEKDTAQSATSIRVTGMGWWRNRELRQTLKLLEPEEGSAQLDASLVEDAVVLLQSALERDGFLQPSGSVKLRRGGGMLGDFPWTSGDVPAVPRDLRADHAVFNLEPGVRYTFAALAFTGLTALERDAARSYFVEEGFLFDGAGTRRFTPAALRRGVGNLREELVRRGHVDATVEVESETRDDRTGDVAVTITVNEGPLHQVGEVAAPAEVPAEVSEQVLELCERAKGARYSPLWQQDFLQSVRRVFSAEGYAEARIGAAPQTAPAADADGVVRHQLALTAEVGSQIHVGEVRFEGYGRTRLSVLERAAQLDSGNVFDGVKLEQDRRRLGGLGVFSSVQTTVEKNQPAMWDVVHQVKPGKAFETSVLFGYGSYEQFRGGVEVSHANLFGQAHRGRLQLVLSQKSASGDYLYTVPQIFGTTTDVSARVFGLDREEVSFDRREYGASVGARRRLLGADAALRYQFEAVNADIFDPNNASDAPTDSNVASLTMDLTRDRRDNPLTPHQGTLLAMSLETATKAIGGEVDYQRLDVRASWHRPVGKEKYVHLGLRHGVVWALSGSSADDIPLARRYFPGGEGTVRGYVEGRASPRAPDGTFIGAEVSTVFNAEFEQGLAKNLAVVIFTDVGLTATRLAEYPGDQTRVSVGLGLRYNTVIGPARLEYGHNVVRETGDARDAWHLALGFPF